MRWFVVVLLVANVVLYFWVQQQSRPADVSMHLPPPDVGRLRLLSEDADPTPAQGVVLFAEIPGPGPQVAAAEEVDGSGADERPAGSTAGSGVVREALTPEEPELEGMMKSEAKPSPVAEEREIVPVAVADGPPAARAVGAEAGLAEPPSSLLVEKGAAQQQSADPPGEVDGEGAVSEPSNAAADPDPYCARIGPLESEAADRLIAGLPLQIVVTTDDTEVYQQVDGYYVLIPAASTRAQGLDTLANLKDAGFKDVWLFRSGTFENAISLGLFRQESSARRHVETVRRKGFVAEVRERTSEKSGRWLELRNVHGGGLPQLLPLPLGAAVESIPCT